MPRTIIVSGGGTGIGRATTEMLVLDGEDVIILGRRAEVLEATANEIRQGSGAGRVYPKAVDLTNAAAVEALAGVIKYEFGVVDGVVNNAGGTAPGGGSLLDVESMWRRTFEQNVLSAVLLTTALAPLLRRPGGRIVLIGSMASRSGGGGAHYVATKAALNGWVLALSTEFAPQGINANVVLPGYTPGTACCPRVSLRTRTAGLCHESQWVDQPVLRRLRPPSDSFSLRLPPSSRVKSSR